MTKTKEHYLYDKHDFPAAMYVRGIIYAALFYLLPFKWAFATLIAFMAIYPHVVAAIYGLEVMPLGDKITFCSLKNSRSNIMCATSFNVSRPDLLKENWLKFMKVHLKSRATIERRFGDLYYKEIKDMSLEEIYDKYIITELPAGTITNEKELAQFYAKNIESELPLDKPFWRLWY